MSRLEDNLCRFLHISYVSTWGFAMYTIYNIAQPQVSLKESTLSAESLAPGVSCR